MKILPVISLSTIAILTVYPIINTTPVIANPINTQASTDKQTIQSLQLNIWAEKKVVIPNQHGKSHTWQTLQGNVFAQPGDIIRYTISGKNNSTHPVKGFVVTQPIPKQTTYILNSVAVKDYSTKVTYSIDNGHSFVEKPNIQVKLPSGKVGPQPIPEKAYTHLRWKFTETLAPAKAVQATYQVQVN